MLRYAVKSNRAFLLVEKIERKHQNIVLKEATYEFCQFFTPFSFKLPLLLDESQPDGG
jgi:hypothetical protein